MVLASSRKAAEEEKYTPTIQPREKHAGPVGKVAAWNPNAKKDEVLIPLSPFGCSVLFSPAVILLF